MHYTTTCSTSRLTARPAHAQEANTGQCTAAPRPKPIKPPRARYFAPSSTRLPRGTPTRYQRLRRSRVTQGNERGAQAKTGAARPTGHGKTRPHPLQNQTTGDDKFTTTLDPHLRQLQGPPRLETPDTPTPCLRAAPSRPEGCPAPLRDPPRRSRQERIDPTPRTIEPIISGQTARVSLPAPNIPTRRIDAPTYPPKSIGVPLQEVIEALAVRRGIYAGDLRPVVRQGLDESLPVLPGVVLLRHRDVFIGREAANKVTNTARTQILPRCAASRGAIDSRSSTAKESTSTSTGDRSFR